MAVDKLVDGTQLDANLASVANAIRAKGGTAAQMAFPTGFVSAVQAIPTGTTPTGTKQISITQNGTTTEDVAAYANAEITVNVSGGINILNVNEPSGAFVSDYPGTNGIIKRYALAGRIGITSIHLTAAQQLADYAVSYCDALTVLVGEQLKAIAGYGAYSNTALVAIDALGGNGTYERLYNNALSRCSALKTLIIRESYCWTLGGTGTFTSTPFASNGTGGTLYVPQAMISTYQTDATWSTILSYTNNQILPIEGSQYENYYADGTPIT